MRALTLSVALFAGILHAQQPATGARELSVTVGKSVLVDSPSVIERVSVASSEVAEAVAITPREVLVNGKTAGETSLIVWQQGGNRLMFDLTVRRNESRVESVRRQMNLEMGNSDVNLDLEGESVFLRGSVPNLTEADRALAIASVLGKPVNLLRVAVPKTDAQILLKVRFADVDRSAIQQLGINFLSTGAAGGTIGALSTGQFAPPQLAQGGGTPIKAQFNLTDILNVFVFRPDLNLGATVKALQANNLLQILAEPNLLTINGHAGSFLAGGEFPFPTLQGGGAGLGAVTIQFREFGVRINFIPRITPRGTIRLTVTPEVSSLDFSNGLVFQGFTIPALSTRRVQTEIELDNGQSFAIGGLLDNRTTQTLQKIPGLGDIPFFGRLFRSRQVNRSNTELLVMVTPELVQPIPADKPKPELNFPGKFLAPNTAPAPPRTPGVEVTGMPSPARPATIPVEDLVRSERGSQSDQHQQAPIQFVPVPLMPQPAQPAPPKPNNPPAANSSSDGQ